MKEKFWKDRTTDSEGFLKDMFACGVLQTIKGRYCVEEKGTALGGQMRKRAGKCIEMELDGYGKHVY